MLTSLLFSPADIANQESLSQGHQLAYRGVSCTYSHLCLKHQGRSFQGVKKGQQEAPSMAYDLWQSTP